MEEVNLFQTISGMTIFIAILAIFFGVIIKSITVILSILAFPTYLGIYALEAMFTKKTKDSILKFYIPKESKYKRIMNGFATVITGVILKLLLPIFSMESFPYINIKYLESLLFGLEVNIEIAIIFWISIAAVYLISYFFADRDESSSWDKIENITIPSLWKGLTKSSIDN